MTQIIDALLFRYHNADVRDFGALALAVIVLCWFISRYSAD
jgi:hypothetical protein